MIDGDPTRAGQPFAPSVPKAASEPPSKEALIADWYAQTSPRTDDERRIPASPVSGRNLTPEEQAAYTEFRKRHATKLSGPVSGEPTRDRQPCSVTGRHIYAEGKCQFCGAPVSGETVAELSELQETVGQAYYLVTGRSPQWADTFGHVEALQEIDDAQRLLRGEIARLKADSLSPEERTLVLEVIEQAKVQSWANGTVLSDSYLNLRKKLRRLSQSSEDSEKMNDSSALQLTPDEASKAWNAVTHYAPATNFETRQHYYSLIEKLDKGRRASGGRKGLTICAACEDGAHELCGLQSWCKCTCRPQSSESPK